MKLLLLRPLAHRTFFLADRKFVCNFSQVALATFTTYSLAYRHDPEQQLTADRAFVALSLFNILQFPLTILPEFISMAVQARVSVKRLSTFLKNEELDPNLVERNLEPASGSYSCNYNIYFCVHLDRMHTRN